MAERVTDRLRGLSVEAERVERWSDIRAIPVDSNKFEMAERARQTARAAEITADESRPTNQVLAELINANLRAEEREETMLRWTKASALAAVVAALLALASFVVAVVALS
jgi:hypothetical protein